MVINEHMLNCACTVFTEWGTQTEVAWAAPWKPWTEIIFLFCLYFFPLFFYYFVLFYIEEKIAIIRYKWLVSGAVPSREVICTIIKGTIWSLECPLFYPSAHKSPHDKLCNICFFEGAAPGPLKVHILQIISDSVCYCCFYLMEM